MVISAIFLGLLYPIMVPRLTAKFCPVACSAWSTNLPRFWCTVCAKIEQLKASFAKSNKLSVDDPAVVAEIDLLVAGVEAERSNGELLHGRNYFRERLKFSTFNDDSHD
ncbi:CBM_HP2_G0022710.mRNA.1.CDS.1 [Saccharomyces cerevisiae]|nr:CBM_HP2_G0022710.mRNA.1.CDS.1 [Saccharomyces cerevisiae]CAI6719915.1 CBM_HP2_G0022710.mRNA.1.CDS.1 [Saccharomyces cerevisiae]